ncbi:MAG: sugar phosphate isomerase/epimerase, partial [Ornithinimicrobium sp.]
ISIAVENMFPWRVSTGSIAAYLPDHDPTDLPYDHVTLDISHAGTAGRDALQMLEQLGSRVAHVHLGDSNGTFKDEHLVPGRGTQRCAEVLSALANSEYAGVVSLEVSTRKRDRDERELDLAEALEFARKHLAVAASSR